MQLLKTNWPTILGVAVTVVLFVLGNRGVLTSDQLSQIFAFIGLGGMTGTRYMQSPKDAALDVANPQPVTHITIPPRGES